MSASKKIGRQALFKYWVIFVVSVAALPVVMELFSRGSFRVLKAMVDVYKLNSMTSSDVLQVFAQWAVTLLGIWYVGGKLGEGIIEKEKPKYALSASGVFLVWMIHFLSGSLLMLSSWHPELPHNMMLSGMIYFLYFCIGLGVLHSLLVFYFLGKEIERKGHLFKQTFV